MCERSVHGGNQEYIGRKSTESIALTHVKELYGSEKICRYDVFVLAWDQSDIFRRGRENMSVRKEDASSAQVLHRESSERESERLRQDGAERRNSVFKEG